MKRSGLVAQWLEHTLDKRGVGGSNPSWPTKLQQAFRAPDKGGVAQLGERLFCTQEVIGSIPFTSTFRDCVFD